MKWGKFDGNKSGFILIYAASCRFSCPADDCNCKTWARGKASSFPPGQDSTVAGITFDRNTVFAHYIESYFPLSYVTISPLHQICFALDIEERTASLPRAMRTTGFQLKLSSICIIRKYKKPKLSFMLEGN